MVDTLVIAPGDVVMLKSGGPEMTVEGLHPAPLSVAQRIGETTGQMVRVAWADATGAVNEGAFWLHMMVKKADTSKERPIEREPLPSEPSKEEPRLFTPPAEIEPERVESVNEPYTG